MKNMMNKVSKRLKSTIVKYYLFQLFSDLSLFTAVLVPFFTEWGGISFSKIQILQSWFMLWIFILEIPTGAVADYFGRKQSLYIGTFIKVIAMLVYGSFPSYQIFLLAEFLFAAGVAFVSGANDALLYDALKQEGKEERSKKIFGKAHSFKLLGMLIAAPLGSVIASKFSLNMPMLLSAIPTFLAFLIILTIEEPEYKSKESESRRYLNIIKEGLSVLLKNLELKKLMFNSVLVSASAYFVIWYYQPLLEKINVPILYFGLVHGFLVIIEILISSNFEKIEKILKGERGYMLFSILSVFLAFILVGIRPSYITILFFIIFAGGFGLTYQQYISAMMQKHIPSNERATVASFLSMFKRFALVLLNPIMGIFADINLSFVLGFAGIIALLSLFTLRVRFKNID
ncbi:MFS transporter [Patescibacteria group bacterium]